jgi:outer membrane protein OmpA-like peptidoglycan-associated protein
MKPIVSSSRAVTALVIGSAVTCACGSSQKELTAPQQAAAYAEEQSQKAQADAQKARDEANKTQKDLAEAQQAHAEARQAEMAADQRAQAASRQAGMAEQQAGMAARPPPAAPPSAPPEKGVAEAQGGPHAGHDSAGKVVVITASLLFKSGSAELLPSAKPKLDEIAGALQAQPQASNVKVQGYTDSTGTAAINDPLSQQRAQAVADYLQSKGVPQDRISAQGFGKQDPVSHAQTTEGRALNRRVDIVIEPVTGEPGKAEPGQAPGQATPPAQPSQHGQPSQPQP